MWVGEGDLRVLVCILQELIKCRGSFRVVQAIESWTMGMEVYRIWRFKRQIRTFLGASVDVRVFNGIICQGKWWHWCWLSALENWQKKIKILLELFKSNTNYLHLTTCNIVITVKTLADSARFLCTQLPVLPTVTKQRDYCLETRFHWEREAGN